MEEKTKLNEYLDDAVTYRFVRSPGNAAINHRNSHGVFKLCKYRPNITKKGRVLWKLDGVLIENLLFQEVHDGYGYYNANRTKCMLALRTDVETAEVAQLLTAQRATSDRHGYRVFKAKPVYEICFKLLNSFSGLESNDIIDPHAGTLFWVPVRNDVISMRPANTLVPEGELGLHNKEFIEGELSQHEYFRVMRALKSKGWQTKKR